MRPFPKTDGLFARDPENPKRITNEHRHPIYSQLKGWWVEEKLDGTNCRIQVQLLGPHAQIDVKGRSDAAQLPGMLKEALDAQAKLLSENYRELREAFPTGDDETTLVCFYGEGLGPKVQGNPYGLDACEFRLFDIKVGDHPERGWLAPTDVHQIGASLGFKLPAMVSGNAELAKAIAYVREATISSTYFVPFFEGVVCKARVPMYDARGRLIRLKLKPTNIPSHA